MWKELYDFFLFKLCEKPNEYFEGNIKSKCVGLINALMLPNSELRYEPKKQVELIYKEDVYVSCVDNKQEDLRIKALMDVYHEEQDWYIKKYMELLLEGNNLTDIKKLTKNQLPTYELTRVFKIIKSKVKQKYKYLCN